MPWIPTAENRMFLPSNQRMEGFRCSGFGSDTSDLNTETFHRL